MEAATRRTWSRVSFLTASGRENGRETVDLCTPAAAATSSMLGVDTGSSLSAVRVSTPDHGHRRLKVTDPWKPNEPTTKLVGDLVDEPSIQRVAVHVEECSLRNAVDGGEGRLPVGPDRRAPRVADSHEGAVPLKR